MTRTRQMPQSRLMLKPTQSINESGAASVMKVTLQSLFDSEETGLLHYAFSLVGRRAVAEEIVQEVFLQLHGQWNEVECPKAWLYRSVRNRSYNHNRDSKREVLNEDNSDVPSLKAEGLSCEAIQLHDEAIVALRDSIAELDESDRQLVKLKYFTGLKYREISNESGLKIGNVGYRLHHILKELAAKMRQLGFDENS